MKSKMFFPVFFLTLLFLLLPGPVFAASAKTGFVRTSSGLQYLKNGTPVTNKWKTSAKTGKKYYFDESGYAVTGKKKIGKKLCYFSKKGVLTRFIRINRKMIAITYDDGPSIYTPAVLKALKANGGVATFFVVGNRVNSYKKTLKQAYKMGCEIGNHSWDHSNLAKLGSSGIRSQISRTNKAVKAITGEAPTILRPPYGATSGTLRSLAGMPLIIWSVDTLDWKTRSTSSTIASVKKYAKDGAIILMHDIHKPTTDAAKTIIPWLVKQGYQLVTVSEMAECRGGMKNGKSYYSITK